MKKTFNIKTIIILGTLLSCAFQFNIFNLNAFAVTKDDISERAKIADLYKCYSEGKLRQITVAGDTRISSASGTFSGYTVYPMPTGFGFSGKKKVDDGTGTVDTDDVASCEDLILQGKTLQGEDEIAEFLTSIGYKTTADISSGGSEENNSTYKQSCAQYSAILSTKSDSDSDFHVVDGGWESPKICVNVDEDNNIIVGNAANIISLSGGSGNLGVPLVIEASGSNNSELDICISGYSSRTSVPAEYEGIGCYASSTTKKTIKSYIGAWDIRTIGSASAFDGVSSDEFFGNIYNYLNEQIGSGNKDLVRWVKQMDGNNPSSGPVVAYKYTNLNRTVFADKEKSGDGSAGNSSDVYELDSANIQSAFNKAVSNLGYKDNQRTFYQKEAVSLYNIYLTNYANTMCTSDESEIAARDANPGKYYVLEHAIVQKTDGSGNEFSKETKCYVWNKSADDGDSTDSPASLNGVNPSTLEWATSVSISDIVTFLNAQSLSESDLDDVIAIGQVTLDSNAKQGSAGEGKEEKPSCYTGAGALGYILCPVLTAVADTVQSLYENIIEPFLAIPSDYFDQDGSGYSVYKAWQVFQNIANIIFVIVILIVIFSQLTGFGIDNYGVKRLLPRIIVAAVLINLSYFICQLAVDVSNIAGVGLRSLFDTLSQKITPSFDVTYNLGNSVSWTSTFVTGAAIVGAITLLPAIVSGIAAAGAALATIVTLLITGITALASFVFLFALLAARQAAVVILTVISPVAIVMYLLPNTRTSLYKRWFDLMKTMLILYPVCSLLVGGSNFASVILLSLGSSDFFFGLAAMLVNIVPFFFIPTLVKSAFRSLGNIGNTLANLNRNAALGARRAYQNSDFYKDNRARVDAARKAYAADKGLTGRIARRMAASNVPGLKGLGASMVRSGNLARKNWSEMQAQERALAETTTAEALSGQQERTVLAAEAQAAANASFAGDAGALNREGLRRQTELNLARQNKTLQDLADPNSPAFETAMQKLAHDRSSQLEAAKYYEVKEDVDKETGVRTMRTDANGNLIFKRGADGGFIVRGRDENGNLIRVYDANGNVIKETKRDAFGAMQADAAINAGREARKLAISTTDKGLQSKKFKDLLDEIRETNDIKLSSTPESLHAAEANLEAQDFQQRDKNAVALLSRDPRWLAGTSEGRNAVLMEALRSGDVHKNNAAIQLAAGLDRKTYEKLEPQLNDFFKDKNISAENKFNAAQAILANKRDFDKIDPKYAEVAKEVQAQYNGNKMVDVNPEAFTPVVNGSVLRKLNANNIESITEKQALKIIDMMANAPTENCTAADQEYFAKVVDGILKKFDKHKFSTDKEHIIPMLNQIQSNGNVAKISRATDKFKADSSNFLNTLPNDQDAISVEYQNVLDSGNYEDIAAYTKLLAGGNYAQRAALESNASRILSSTSNAPADVQMRNAIANAVSTEGVNLSRTTSGQGTLNLANDYLRNTKTASKISQAAASNSIPQLASLAGAAASSNSPQILQSYASGVTSALASGNPVEAKAVHNISDQVIQHASAFSSVDPALVRFAAADTNASIATGGTADISQFVPSTVAAGTAGGAAVQTITTGADYQTLTSGTATQAQRDTARANILTAATSAFQSGDAAQVAAFTHVLGNGDSTQYNILREAASAAVAAGPSNGSAYADSAALQQGLATAIASEHQLASYGSSSDLYTWAHNYASGNTATLSINASTPDAITPKIVSAQASAMGQGLRSALVSTNISGITSTISNVAATPSADNIKALEEVVRELNSAPDPKTGPTRLQIEKGVKDDARKALHESLLNNRAAFASSSYLDKIITDYLAQNH